MKNNWNNEYGKIFTKEMKDDLFKVELELKKLNIKYDIKNYVLCFNKSEIIKLPKDKNGHYLPYNSENGFEFYKIYKEDYLDNNINK